MTLSLMLFTCEPRILCCSQNNGWHKAIKNSVYDLVFLGYAARVIDVSPLLKTVIYLLSLSAYVYKSGCWKYFTDARLDGEVRYTPATDSRFVGIMPPLRNTWIGIKY